VLLWCYYVSLVFLFSACIVRVLTSDVPQGAQT